jgi:hypothetical protein
MYCGHKRGRWFFWGIPFVLFFIALGSALVMLLWNALLPEIFGIKAIGYWQAAGVLILSRILFGGFGRTHRPFTSYRHWNKHAEMEPESPTGENAKA